MAELDATRQRGWSYYAGYSRACREYVARAWKQRAKPYKTPSGVTLVMHSLSGQGATIDEAAQRCAAEVAWREAGGEHDQRLSFYEQTFVERQANL